MTAGDWLSATHGEAAIDRILDSAAQLFAQRPAASVGMNEIASAAGCSRATLYRYFDNREALHTAFVHREAYAVHHAIIERLHGIDDPQEKVVTAFMASLELVRNSPALLSWFSTGDAPIGAGIAEQSEVIKTMGSGLILSLGNDDPVSVDRKARWLVRILVSLLSFPGRDAADERTMIKEFVVPIVTPPIPLEISRAPG